MRILPIAATLLAASSLSAQATTLTFNNLMFQDSPEKWDGYNYATYDGVRTLNELGSRAMLEGHKALGLERAPLIQRLLYMGIGGTINMRYQWANSIIFGHEGSHFQNATRFGLNNHYFMDETTGATLSRFDAWKNVFTGMSVGGPAASGRDPDGVVDHEGYSTHGIHHSLHGTNWQTTYSQRWIKSAMLGDKNVFDSLDYTMNRAYLSMYALGDFKRAGSNDINGDFYKFAKHMNPDDPRGELRKITLISMATTYMLSPMTTQSLFNTFNYVNDGQTDFKVPTFKTRYGDMLYDLPTYLNFGSYTIAPTVYLNANSDLKAKFGGADKLLLNASLEVAALGEAKPELTLGFTGAWDRLTADVSLSTGGSGVFSELEVGYNVHSNFALIAGAAVSDGETLRGPRNLPLGDTVLWGGARISF